MHTATRLAAPLIARVRRVNPSARLAAYGLYAPLNVEWLRGQGVQHVLGPEAEGDLVALAGSQFPIAGRQRLQFIAPDRTALPPVGRHAALPMADRRRGRV